MKGNDGSGNMPERDEWQTPQELFDKLNKQYNFSFDCCATKENKKCHYYSSDFIKIISTLSVMNVAWMNPPFSKAYKMFEHFFESVQQGVSIYRCDNMETKLWQDVILINATWILIPKGRICYEGFEGKGSRFPSALIGFNVTVPEYVSGSLLMVNK